MRVEKEHRFWLHNQYPKWHTARLYVIATKSDRIQLAAYCITKSEAMLGIISKCKG